MPSFTSDVKAGSAFVELLLRDEKFLGGLKKAKSKLKSFGTAVRKIGKFAVFAGSGALAALAFPLKLAANLETARAQFEVLTGSAGRAIQIIGELEQFSKIALIPIDALQRGAQTLLGYGAAVKEVVPSLKALAEISRGSADRFSRLTLALGQTFAKTRLYAQEVRQFVEAGLNPLQQIAQKTGETMKEVQERMAAGAISAKEVAQALRDATSEGGRFHGLLEKLGETFEGKLQKLLVGFNLAIRPLGEDLSFSLKKAIDAALEALPVFADFVKENAHLAVTVGKAALALVVLGGGFIAIGSTIKLLAFSLGGISLALGLVIANPVVVGLGLVAIAFAAIAREASRANDSISRIDLKIRKLQRSKTFGDSSDLQLLIKRLEELGAKTKLTRDEQKEARRIIHELRMEYGKLAFGVKTAATEISNFDKGMAQIEAAQRSRSVASIKSEISLEELAVSALNVGGKNVDDRLRRRNRLVELRKELAEAERIIAEADADHIGVSNRDKNPISTAVGAYVKSFFDLVDEKVRTVTTLGGNRFRVEAQIRRAQRRALIFHREKALADAKAEAKARAKLDSGKIKDEIFGSFSAAALEARGGGAGATDKAAEEIKKLDVKQQRRHDEVLVALEGGGGRLTA